MNIFIYYLVKSLSKEKKRKEKVNWLKREEGRIWNELHHYFLIHF